MRGNINGKVKLLQIGVVNFLFVNIIKQDSRMISKRLTKENSGILSQRDLAAYFDAEQFRRNSASIFNKSQWDSPKSSRSEKQEISESETGTQNLEEEVARLNEIISLEKARCETLTAENSTLAKQLHVQDTLIKQLNLQKEKLLEQVHYARKSHEQVQQERNKLLIETGRLRTEINLMRATLDINEQQISTFQSTNRKLIDEINFEKEMLADYKLQNAMFKGQLKNISNAFVSLKEFILEERQRSIKEAHQLMNGKISQIKSQLSTFKGEIKKIANQQSQLIDHKDSMFRFFRRIELSYQSTRTQLSIAKSLSNNVSFDESFEPTAFKERQAQFRKTIESQEATIKYLSTEIAGLKKRNAELADELSTSTNIQLLAPNFHTNTGYLNKLIKQNAREIQEIKQIIDMKDSQIQRLRETIQLERNASTTKSEEIEKLHILLKLEQNKSYAELSNQIEQLKAEKVRLNRRIDQLGQVQTSLKAEIIDKDRIILNYVQKSKAK